MKMPGIQIASLDDPRTEIYRDLPGSSVERQAGYFIAESELVVMRLLDSAFEVQSIFASERVFERIAPRAPASVPIFVAQESILKKIVGFNFNRGALACGVRQPSPDLGIELGRFPETVSVIVCSHMTDPTNLGAILRSCACLGVDLVVLGPHCTDPFSRRVLRVSMGNTFRLPIIESKDLASDLRRMRREFGIELAAAVAEPGAEPLSEARRTPRFGIVLGHETHGLDETYLAACQRRIVIPMRVGVDSLNVSVASGILLYHFMNHR